MVSSSALHGHIPQSFTVGLCVRPTGARWSLHSGQPCSGDGASGVILQTGHGLCISRGPHRDSHKPPSETTRLKLRDATPEPEVHCWCGQPASGLDPRCRAAPVPEDGAGSYSKLINQSRQDRKHIFELGVFHEVIFIRFTIRYIAVSYHPADESLTRFKDGSQSLHPPHSN